MNKELITTFKEKNLELKKPSELCQVLYYSDFSKLEFANLSALQLDLIGVIFYIISITLENQNISEEEIYNWTSTNYFEINLKTITEIIGKYENGFYAPLVKNLQELSKIQVLTNILRKNKTQESSLFHFIRKISWTKSNNTYNKKIKIWIEPELLSMFLNTKILYTKFILQIQFGLKSKYSKLLYEILRDYNGIGIKKIDFEILVTLLNIDLNKKPQMAKWSNFNRDILKKSILEINQKSDIKITAEPIKEKIGKKLKVTEVLFTISKQNSDLIKQIENSELKTHIISESNIKTHTLSPEDEKLIKLAYKQIEKAKEFGTVIKNQEKYLEAVIKDLKAKKLPITKMIELDKILDEIKSDFKDIKSHKNQLLVMENFENYPIVTVSNEYLLYSPIDKSIISKTIDDTINKIIKFKNNGGIFKIIEMNEKISEIEISYL